MCIMTIARITIDRWGSIRWLRRLSNGLLGTGSLSLTLIWTDRRLRLLLRRERITSSICHCDLLRNARGGPRRHLVMAGLRGWHRAARAAASTVYKSRHCEVIGDVWKAAAVEEVSRSSFLKLRWGVWVQIFFSARISLSLRWIDSE